MTVGGVILLIVAVVCFFIARGQMNQLRAMSAVETYSADLLTQLHGQVTSTLGGEAMAQQCEIEGVIECDTPLPAPLSGTPSVAYRRTLVREYEEDVTTTDDKGNRTTKAEKRSETLENEDRRVNFWVRDSSGRALVCPEGADLDLVETVNRYEAAPSTGYGRTRTLGRRHTEQALAIGTQVYVHGCAVDKQGQLAISRNPRDTKQRFFVSRKSERELTTAAQSAARNFYYAAAGTGALGAVLLVIGLLR